MDNAELFSSLSEMETRAVSWLSTSLWYFDPDTYGASDRLGRLGARKALLELSILLAYRARLDSADPSPQYRRLIDCLSEVTARRSYCDLISRQPRSLWLYGFPYIALNLWGRADPEYKKIIEQSVASRYPVGWERVPYRQVDYLHFLGLIGLCGAPARLQAAFSLTVLASEPNVLMLEEDDAYAMTHTIFYMTDFGLSTPAWPASFNVTGASDAVSLLLARFRATEQTDLVAELAAASLCLGSGESLETERSWRYLLQRQRNDGSLQTPVHLVAGPDLRGSGGKAYSQWKGAYHTTAMTALAALMARRALSERDYPIAKERTRAISGSSRDDLGRRVDDGSKRAAAWLQAGGEGKVRGTKRLADWADALVEDVTPALVQAALDYRLGEVAQLLRGILHLAAPSRLAYDAVEFLLSQQRPDGSFGYSAQNDEDGRLRDTRLVWTREVLSALETFSRAHR